MAAKYNWTDEQVAFIKANFKTMTARQIVSALGIDIAVPTLRMKYYELGLKKMEMEYWDEYQIAFLYNNYQQMGDLEIAEVFNAVCPKQKQWTLKHIEKKRNYLNLHRTPAELKAIKQRNRELGCWIEGSKKSWETRGTAPEGTIRLWKRQGGRVYPYIKIKGQFIHWAPYAWEQKYGLVPNGYNVVFKDYNLNKLTDINNLEMISDADLAKRNSINNYSKELVSTMMLIGHFKNKINKRKQLLEDEK